MTSETTELIELVSEFQTITPEVKSMIILQIEQQNFEPDFFEILSSLLDEEIETLEVDIENINSDIQDIRAKKEAEKTNILPRLKKIKAEYLQITEKLLEGYQSSLDAYEKESQWKLETAVRTETDDSQIASIRQLLQK